MLLAVGLVGALSVASAHAEPVLRVLFVGDTFLGESYASGSRALAKYGYDHGFEALDPLLKKADVAIANLEAPVTKHRDPALVGKKPFLHHADPIRTPATLKRHGLRVLSLANNHAMDQGATGLSETLEVLATEGLETFGAGLDQASAMAPWVRDLPLAGGSFRLVVAAGFEYRSYHRKTLGFYAGEEKAGVNRWSTKRVAAELGELRKREPDAFLVAFPHWGVNYRWRSRRQRRLAPVLVDAGVDLVIGHGAHALQEVMQVGDRWVVHSLGNFVFHTSGRFEEKGCHPFSLVAMLELRVEEGVCRARLLLYPILSDNRKTGYQPRPVTGAEFVRVRELLVAHALDRAAQIRDLTPAEDSFGPYLELSLGEVRGWRPAEDL